MPWRPVVLRGTRVLARCNASGALVEHDGRVEIRYRANDGKSYRALARNLELGSGVEVFPDEHCGEAAPAAPADKRAGASGAAASPAKSRARKASPSAAPAPSSADLIAYTDGACSGNPGPAGLGVVLLERGARRELSEYLGVGTNNIAELTAILRALEALGACDEELLVHTDSKYAIGVLTQGWKAKANQALIADIKARMRGFPQLRLVYVPGHAGVPLNERADELARAAVAARSSAGWVEVKGAHGQLG